MKTKKTVPFHEAKLEKNGPIKLVDPMVVSLKDNRRVEVWRTVKPSGYCIRIFRPTLDGKTSKLVFGLTHDAMIALSRALAFHTHAWMELVQNLSEKLPTISDKKTK